MGKIHFVKVRSQKIQCKGDNNHELHYATPYDCRGFGWSGQAVTGVFNFWRYMAKSLASWRFKLNVILENAISDNGHIPQSTRLMEKRLDDNLGVAARKIAVGDRNTKS